MPSAASVLGFTKSERDVLGGWAGSQRYTRTAKYKIAQMQIAVASTFKNSDPDQLAESDDLDCLADFLRSWGRSGFIDSEINADFGPTIVFRSPEV